MAFTDHASTSCNVFPIESHLDVVKLGLQKFLCIFSSYFFASCPDRLNLRGSPVQYSVLHVPVTDN